MDNGQWIMDNLEPRAKPKRFPADFADKRRV